MDQNEAILAHIRAHPGTSAHDIKESLNIPERTIFRLLKNLVAQKQISRFGHKPHITYAISGVSLPSKNRVGDPPLLSLQITNPITYLKLWWKKVMGNEGVDLHLKIKPLTAIGMIAVLSGGSFALGRISLPEPVIKYLPQLAPSPSPNPWKEAAYTGTFKQINNKYILSTGEGESVILDVPATVNIPKILNKRILAIGQYNTTTKILKVTEATDMEVLPVPIIPVPTTTPSPSPIIFVSPSPSP